MAMTIYANIKLNGEDVTGEVGVSAIGRINVSQHHIEVHGFHHDLSFAASTDTRRGAGHRVHGPIVFTKRVDAASPLLFQGLSHNQQVDAVFKFFRTAPGTGQPQMFHVVEAQRGRISGVRTEMLNNLTPEGAPMPYLERVSVVYHTIIVRNLPQSIEWQDSWDAIQ